ncbi:transposase [Plantactinospora soyae]|uniref:Transposase n=1 Tax=Plantactinospora soyae TaxID=1544732 RepID=A0A927R8U9_9ACTN|nr:hypothetical protein [Plantactinospora soyae]MBE1490769.1 transposase [Plantactinospora soyae]
MISKAGRTPRHWADPLVERCFSKFKQFRAIAARFDKLASRYRSGLLLASHILWLRHTELPDTA